MSFTFATRFRQAAAEINNITVERLPMLLTRIIEKLHLRNTELFSVDEQTKLKALFGLSDESLKLALDGLCYLFEQAAFSGTGPEPLYDILLEAGFDVPHAKCIGRFWSTDSSSFVMKLKAKTLGSSSLTSTDYHLNIRMCDSQLSKLQDPTALFEFSIAHPNTTQDEKLCVEFAHDELYSFFSDLQRIQKQLDDLSA